MQPNLSADILDCLRRAEDCAARGKREPNPELQRDFFEMEMRWLELARSFQFADQLRPSNGHRESPADGGLTARLNSLKRKLDGGDPGSGPELS